MGRPFSPRHAEKAESSVRLFARRHRSPRRLEPQDAYDVWAHSYPPYAHNELMRVEQSSLLELLRLAPASRALDVGTGSGRYLHILESLGASRAVGIDLSQAMLSRAREAAPEARLIRGDALALPVLPGSMDLIVSSLMVGDVADLARWVSEMARALQSGGCLLYSDFHPEWAERGFRRSFTTREGVEAIVAYHPHMMEDHRGALARAGLEIVRCEEPRVRRDGEEEDLPTVVVFLARKS